LCALGGGVLGGGVLVGGVACGTCEVARWYEDSLLCG
jgi:hypothetical protein